jgi:cytidyltransferase-like protein
MPNKSSQKVIGIKSGCFTLITAGHIKCLEWIKKRCDYLIVIINDDKYIRTKKGCVPISAHERKKILESIKYIDEVHIYSGFNEHMWLHIFKDKKFSERFGNAKMILFHSAEASQKTFIPGHNIVDQIVIVPDFTNLTSTSNIFSTINYENWN